MKRSLLKYITAPAPRFLLRMFEIQRSVDGRGMLGSGAVDAAEIGPGLGDLAAWIQDDPGVRSVTLIEASSEARGVLDSRFRGVDGVSVATGIPEDRAGYGLFFACEVLEHIEDDTEVIAKIFNALAPGGWLVGSVPAFMKKWQAVDDSAGHLRRYERDELHEKLARSGFIDISIDVYGFPVTNMLYPLREIYYRNVIGVQGDTQEEATHRSGISRGLVKRFDGRLIYYLLRAISPLQRLPGARNLGDGFIFLARRPVS